MGFLGVTTTDGRLRWVTGSGHHNIDSSRWTVSRPVVG